MIGSLNLSQTQWARNVVQVSAAVSGEERCVTRQITAAWETRFARDVTKILKSKPGGLQNFYLLLMKDYLKIYLSTIP